MIRSYIILVAFFLLSTTVKADGILMSWGPKDLIGMTAERFEASKKWTSAEILDRVRTATEWLEIYLLLVAAKQHKDDKALIDSLINEVSNPAQNQVGLTSRLIIWDRITSGDILFEGKGVQINDDLFRISGRANWLLRNLTSQNFGYVRMKYTADSLVVLQDKWTKWRKGQDVAPFINPYETTSTGLSEIKSIEALEAIIHSLKSSPAKEQLILDCLKKIYNLTELPKDPGSPASYCSPDTHAYFYLATLTGVKEKQSAAWWKKWWEENNAKLLWEKSTGQFQIKQ